MKFQDYDVLLVIAAFCFILAGILLAKFFVFAEVDPNGNIIEEPQPELKCLEFNDGKLAIINIGYYCKEYPETISWFLSKGYHIDTSWINSWDNNGRLYMTR